LISSIGSATAKRRELIVQKVPTKVETYDALDDFGRVRLSKNFFMRDFLYSEIANHYGEPNKPSDPQLAVKAGTKLCTELLRIGISMPLFGVSRPFPSVSIVNFAPRVPDSP